MSLCMKTNTHEKTCVRRSGYVVPQSSFRRPLSNIVKVILCGTGKIDDPFTFWRNVPSDCTHFFYKPTGHELITNIHDLYVVIFVAGARA